MRQIKFRAQDIASNKWLYGDIRHHKDDVCIFEQGGAKGEQVKRETIGQFTGLNDGNGKEIYEGEFHEGEWIVDNQGLVHQIERVVENVTTHTFGYDIVGGGYFNDKSEGVHLWTIADAKDGDVLVDVYGNIGIIQEYDDFAWRSYCSLGCNGGFQGFNVEHENDKTHPATQEQRELLFAKMKEAGYEWECTADRV